MKKRKQQYSMTARERKEMRKAEEEKKAKSSDKLKTENSVADTDGTELTVDGMQAEAAVTRPKIWIPITCAVLALVIILTAVLLLLIKPRRVSIYPRAVITLTDGRQLTLTIWETDCPIAATNFIFLADIGFFNNNIIYDVQTQRNYMRFGQYTDYNVNRSKYKDKSFIDSISRSRFNVVNVDDTYKGTAESNKLGYRLKADSGDNAARYTQKYVVSYNRGDTADFVINLGENNTDFRDANGNNQLNSNLVAFGEFEDEESRKILDEIFGYDTVANTSIGSGVIGFDSKYVNGNTNSPSVRIRKIEIENMDEDKWDNLEFVSYMKTILNGGSAFNGWYN